MKIYLLRPLIGPDGQKMPHNMPYDVPDEWGQKQVDKGIANVIAPRIEEPFDGERIHYISPYSLEKDYGAVINETVALFDNIPQDWICLMDQDTMLFPQAPHLIKHVTETYPYVGMFGARTNRIGQSTILNRQRVDSMFEERDMHQHKKYAQLLFNQEGHKVTLIDRPIAGFFMLFRVATWLKVGGFKKKLADGGYFDMHFSNEVLNHGYHIGLINGLYVFHLYRMGEDFSKDDHLRTHPLKS